MASWNKIQGFVGYLGLGGVNLNTDTIKAYFSNATPSASADDVKGDLAEITQEHGYTAPADTQNTYSESAGTGTLAMTDITTTASGGSFGPFQYIAHYDDTHASDILLGWYDYGSALTVNDGESFTEDFGASQSTLV